MIGLELHKHIDIASRAKIVSQHRPEERQTSDVMPAAKIGYLFFVD